MKLTDVVRRHWPVMLFGFPSLAILVWFALTAFAA